MLSFLQMLLEELVYSSTFVIMYLYCLRGCVIMAQHLKDILNNNLKQASVDCKPKLESCFTIAS